MAVPRWAFVAFALGVSAAVVTPVGAKPGEPGAPGHDEGKDKRDPARRDRDKDHDRDDKEHDDEDKDSKRRGMHGRSDDDIDAGRDKDDDKSAAEAKEFGRGLFGRRERAIVDALNRDRRALTDEGREAIRRHWRHLARLLRIRELAAAAKEDAFVARVERDIEREEKTFNARLEKLRGPAPEAGGAR